MALKVKCDYQDMDTSLVDIPLFASADEAVKDIQLNDSTMNIQVIQKSEEEK